MPAHGMGKIPQFRILSLILGTKKVKNMEFKNSNIRFTVPKFPRTFSRPTKKKTQISFPRKIATQQYAITIPFTKSKKRKKKKLN